MRDMAGTLAIFVGSTIAAGGGLGGGGLFVPVFVLIVGMSTKAASAMSQAAILGGSVVNLVMYFRLSHPVRTHRPLPDLNCILIFEPMLLGGTIIGVLLNVIFPNILILICLLVTLLYATARTSRKAIQLWREESRQQQEQVSKTSSSPDPQVQASVNSNVEDSNSVNELTKLAQVENAIDESASSLVELAEACGVVPSSLTPQQAEALQPLIRHEKAVFKPLLFMFVIWVVVSVFSVLKGGHGRSPIDVESCSVGYWALTFGVFPLLFWITFFMARRQVKDYSAKMKNGWSPAAGDIRWTVKRSLFLLCRCWICRYDWWIVGHWRRHDCITTIA